MKTRITELFGIRHPIMLAGMNWLTQPKIVAAVCNAGGLGNLAISSHTPEELRSDIRKIRELTDKPFAVNQILLSPTASANLAVVVEEKVPVVNYTLGRPPAIAPDTPATTEIIPVDRVRFLSLFWARWAFWARPMMALEETRARTEYTAPAPARARPPPRSPSPRRSLLQYSVYFSASSTAGRAVR